MRVSSLKNHLRDVRRGQVFVEFDGDRYEIGSVAVQSNGKEEIVLLVTSRFDELDEAGVSEDDFI